MSENRFDFLRDLVKNVPDINVAEEQSYLECNTIPSSSDGNVIMDQTHLDEQIDIAGSSSRSIHVSFPANGTTAISSASTTASSGSPRNGNKRNFYASTTCSSASSSPKHYQTDTQILNCSTQMNPTFNKQHSLDSYSANTRNATSSTTNGGLAIASSSRSSQPNYYKEISTPDQSVIQYTQKQKLEPNLDIRPPKLTRIDSAPAILSTNNVSSLYSPSIRTTTSTSSSNTIVTPVINFDFSKSLIPTALNPPGSQIQRSTSYQPTTSLPPPLKTIKGLMPPLTPITTTANTYTSLPITSSENSVQVTSPTQKIPDQQSMAQETSTLPAFVKIDICNSPLVKIDYSNLNMSQLSSAPSASSSTTNSPQTINTTTVQSKFKRKKFHSQAHTSTGTTTTCTTTKKNVSGQMTPIINIDLANTHGNSSKLYGERTIGNISITPITTSNASNSSSNFPRMLTTTTSNSSLEMDEDYDNI